MDFAESDRPVKKRRFFVEEPDDSTSLHTYSSSPPPPPPSAPRQQDAPSSPKAPPAPAGFDQGLLEAVVGEKLSPDVVSKIRARAGDNVEQAINVYFDGSWKNTSPPANVQTTLARLPGPPSSAITTPKQDRSSPPTSTASSPPKFQSMPSRRYIGSFGVAGWATRSGSGLIGHEEKIRIERSKTQSSSKLGRGGKLVANKKLDNVVRFLNSKAQEVGRLENESAAWIAPLLDQNICEFDASCVFAPERIRSNDTIFLQLHAFFKREPFQPAGFLRPQEDNRSTGIFEARETQAERDLHLRQISLVKLFHEINLQPSLTSASTEKHKRQELLRAAEVAEQHEQKDPQESSDKPESAASDEEEDGKQLEQDQLDSLYKKAQSFDFNTPAMEPADTFALTLRKYQKQALHWMVQKEKDQKTEHKTASMHPLWEEYQWPTKDADDKDLPLVEGQTAFYVNPYSGEVSLEFPVQEQNCLGGVLADEMGLGKTIEMMSLIHSHRNYPPRELEGDPLASLPRFGRTNSAVAPAPYTTLVVAPMSLLAQWQSEAEKASVEGTVKTLVYYGQDKAVNLQNLCCEANAANAPTVIITSYGVVLSEFTQVANSGGNRVAHGGIFSLDYFRIILDEAHMIKNRQSKTAKACYELAATHRWVLTGTPIVNRLEDLFSLVHFLKVEPWSNFSFWKTFITVPFEAGEYVKALDVVQTVLEPLVMRRTKDMKTPEGEALVPLPPRTIDVESVELSQNEREVYGLIFGRAKRTFSANVEAGTLMKSYTTIFAQILRLRQSCCHPILTRNKDIVKEEAEAEDLADAANGLADDMDLQNLIERFSAESAEQDANAFGAHALKQIQDEAENECPICAEEPMIEQSVAGCWHSACKKCLVDYIQHQIDKGEIPRCFNCREPINQRDLFEVNRHQDEQDEAGNPRISLRRMNQPSSAKITALLTHLKSIRRTSPGSKSVVFSQFTSFLDLIEPSLTAARITFLRFDGAMAQKQRAAVLSEFTSPESKPTVLLLSLRAGGVGLNLTAAERVFMMDPWWSWAVEAQAVDRVHRMGQDKPVKVVRFVCKDSIEEKMLRIQERKKFIASSLGMMSEEEKKVQRIEDIRELLS